jgi:hypothetical protein
MAWKQKLHYGKHLYDLPNPQVYKIASDEMLKPGEATSRN